MKRCRQPSSVTPLQSLPQLLCWRLSTWPRWLLPLQPLTWTAARSELPFDALCLFEISRLRGLQLILKLICLPASLNVCNAFAHENEQCHPCLIVCKNVLFDFIHSPLYSNLERLGCCRWRGCELVCVSDRGREASNLAVAPWLSGLTLPFVQLFFGRKRVQKGSIAGVVVLKGFLSTSTTFHFKFGHSLVHSLSAHAVAGRHPRHDQAQCVHQPTTW